MSLLSRSLRLAAAVLAAVGLLARPARAVVLCPMEYVGPTAAVTESIGPEEHAHHEGHAVSAAEQSSDGERPAEAPAHEVCPDLAHCAVAAPASANELTADDACVRAERVVAAQDRPTSAVSSLEPPPPKKS